MLYFLLNKVIKLKVYNNKNINMLFFKKYILNNLIVIKAFNKNIK